MNEDLEARFKAFADATPLAVSVEELVRASEEGAVPRIWLPAIQRSLVWDNQRIIHFWDSLFRGYPVGTLMAHRPLQQDAVLGVASHEIGEPSDNDLSLFDGQQRLHALRLGFGEVEAPRRRLWVDVAKVEVPEDLRKAGNASGGEELCLPLRISGPGQPFGYQMSKPNEKYGADMLRAFLKRHPGFDRAAAWAAKDDIALIAAEKPVPLAWLLAPDAEARLSGVESRSSVIEYLLDRARQVKQAALLLMPVPTSICSNPDDYRRFFERLGRGGVSLSDKELAYSIIKQRLPHVRAQMESIGGVGRIADEVDLVLGCFRIARTLSARVVDDGWRHTNYPRAEDLAGFDWEGKDGAAALFTEFLPKNIAGGRLRALFEGLRAELCAGIGFLPPMLLTHISGELWHVLLLLRHIGGKAGPGNPRLSSFVLWWLLFVDNEQRAARRIFAAAREGQPLDLSALVRAITADGEAARPVLSRAECAGVLASIAPDTDLLAWDKRFGDRDHLRHWADDRRIRHRALMWLQRDQLAQWPETIGFDPTSDNEDDMPIEFDHLIPQARWAFHWSDSRVEGKELVGFRQGRWHCGNAIGNFRILTSSRNAARGDAQLNDVDVAQPDLSDDGALWIALSAPDRVTWSAGDIRAFQFVTQRRTLRLYARLVEESGIAALALDAGATPAAVPADEPRPYSSTG